MIESACQFGPGGRLSGVLTRPAGSPRAVACILVSSGLVPKFGPYRLYTMIARQLARSGFPVLRFDLGGIGDSLQDHGGAPLKVRTEAEIRAAVDHVAGQYPLDRIVLGGLCSGAEDSFRYATTDRRIGGVFMIDPFAYRTGGWRWRHFIYQATRRSLRHLRIYQPPPRDPAPGASQTGDGGTLIKYRYIGPEESTRALRALIAREVCLHFIYTGGARESFNHAGQLQKMFPSVDFAGRVTLSHLPHMEHTQALQEDRQTLVKAVEDWFTACYGPEPSP